MFFWHSGTEADGQDDDGGQEGIIFRAVKENILPYGEVSWALVVDISAR